MTRTVDEHLIDVLCGLEFDRIMNVVNNKDLWPYGGEISKHTMVKSLRTLMQAAYARPLLNYQSRGFSVTYHDGTDNFEVAWQLTSWSTNPQ